MSALHTQGEWTLDRDGCVCMAGQRVIFDAAPDGASVEEAMANRRLIVAAPKLLAALLPFLAHSSSNEFVTIRVRSADVERAREAAAKADPANWGGA